LISSGEPLAAVARSEGFLFLGLTLANPERLFAFIAHAHVAHVASVVGARSAKGSTAGVHP
jgi:hypothetical protein